MRVITTALLAAVALTAPLPTFAQDVTAGERVFKIQCSACHTVVPGKNMVGPSLHGVVGRVSGQVLGFRYSEPNKKAALTFDAATLDRYLTNPRQMIPGTTMAYAGMKDEQQRKNLIAYLQTLR
jgi:cytochrome c